MHTIELYPFGLDSLILLQSGSDQFSWHNITDAVQFAYNLIAYQDTKNETHHRLSDELLPGRYIDNEYCGRDGNNVEELIWDSNKTIITVGTIRTAAPLDNLTISAPVAVLGDLITSINKIYTTTEIGSRGNETAIYQGPVVARNLGTKEDPIKELYSKSSHFILSGENWIGRSHIETFDLDVSSKAVIVREGVCSIDLSKVKIFTGYDITLRASTVYDITLSEHENAGCITIGGMFLAQNSLNIFGSELTQADGILVSNGVTNIRRHNS